METEIFKFKLKGKTFVIIDWANVYGWFSDPNSKTHLGWEIDPKKLFEYLKSYPEITDINFYYGVESNKQKSVAFKKEIEIIGYSQKSKEVKWVPASLETTAHFKLLVKRLFKVLDNVKNTNSEISNKLYELIKKIETAVNSYYSVDTKGEMAYTFFDEEQFQKIYYLIEELDSELKKLNIDIGNLQRELLEPVKRRKCDFDVEITKDTFNNIDKFKTIILFSGDGDYATLAEDLIVNKKKKVIIVFAKGHLGKEYKYLKLYLQEHNFWGLFLCNVKNLQEFIANKYPQRLFSGA